jgi:hypothetical protein
MTVRQRALAAFLSMFVLWLLSIAASGIGGLETRHVAPWIGIFALFTFFFFALPIVTWVPTRLQLRFWYLVTAGSIGWAITLLSLFFHQSPIQILTVPVGSLFGIWAVCYAVASCGLYLLALQYYNRQLAS